MSAWRHARAIILLPGMVAVVVPAALVARNGVDFAPLFAVLGVPLFGAGFLMWLWTVRLFARIGKGTLAPWDPTTQLVVEGPYAHVRNPMITAVMAALMGEALVFGSTAIAIWAAIFAAINHVFFVVYEEPSVERRFGGAYRLYKQNVPRWVPRKTAWRPNLSEGPGSSVDRAAAF